MLKILTIVFLQKFSICVNLSNLWIKLTALGVSPAFRTRRAERPHSFDFHFSGMHPSWLFLLSGGRKVKIPKLLRLEAHSTFHHFGVGGIEVREIQRAEIVTYKRVRAKRLGLMRSG